MPVASRRLLFGLALIEGRRRIVCAMKQRKWLPMTLAPG